VDWSNWDDQSQWTDWTNEPIAEADNHTTDKPHRKSPGNWNNPAAAEGNLIDFGFGDEELQSKVL